MKNAHIHYSFLLINFNIYRFLTQANIPHSNQLRQYYKQHLEGSLQNCIKENLCNQKTSKQIYDYLKLNN
ncbi:hypothetical protein [Helicobacter sp. WB40]|uniref:hypothetical protein n=1 Tax=Helicobacter sp. WB40 TaxID=3004130 RepID=UPI0022EBF6D7|nr:hypothetical protein [Helicobacter sp. WB40]MDA3967616.1 hypothetical protein [Helicobacter sp. WB40]